MSIYETSIRGRFCTNSSLHKAGVGSYIYAGNYEKVTENGVTREFYYLDGNAIVVKQNGVFTPYFKDNLGSFLSIMDKDGYSVFDAEYDVWGKQEVYLNDIGFRRGYTGHEMWNEFGIINMNGRLYDPTIARFLSPDNYVQAPDNSQNFNRYSYCLNNPLKYNDPSGEFWEWVIAGAIMGAIQSGTMAEMNEGKNFWSGAWKGAIVGAGSAAAGMGVGTAVSSALGSTGAIAGFASGFAGGAVSGFASGTSSAWLNGSSFKSGLQSGLYSSAVSATMGGIIGGIHGGLDAYQHGGNFWTGRGAIFDSVEATTGSSLSSPKRCVEDPHAFAEEYVGSTKEHHVDNLYFGNENLPKGLFGP